MMQYLQTGKPHGLSSLKKSNSAGRRSKAFLKPEDEPPGLVHFIFFLSSLETFKGQVSGGHQETPQPGSWGVGSLLHVETWPHCSVLSAHNWLILSLFPLWGIVSDT